MVCFWKSGKLSEYPHKFYAGTYVHVSCVGSRHAAPGEGREGGIDKWGQLGAWKWTLSASLSDNSCTNEEVPDTVFQYRIRTTWTSFSLGLAPLHLSEPGHRLCSPRVAGPAAYFRQSYTASPLRRCLGF